MRASGAIAPLAAWAVCFGCQEAAAPAPAPIALKMSARVSLYNRTREMHRLEVLPLRQDLEVDCPRLEASPGEVLGRGAFLQSDRPATVELFPGQEISANPEEWGLFGVFPRPCNAVLVRGESLPEVVVWWTTNDPSRQITVDLDAPEELLPRGTSVVLEAEYAGEEPREWREVVCQQDAWPARCDQDAKLAAARRPDGVIYSWRAPHTLRHVELDEPTVYTCPRPTPSALTWDVVQGVFVLEGLEVDSSGCATLTLNRNGTLVDVGVCAPDGVFEGLGPAPGAASQVTFSYQTDLAGGGELFEMTFQGFEVDAQATRVVLGRVSGARLPRYGMEWAAVEGQGCGVRRGGCGQSAEPIALEIVWDRLSRRLEGGEEAHVGGQHLWVVRAERGLARSLVCAPWRALASAVGEAILFEFVVKEDL